MHAPCVQRTGKNNGTLSKKTGESWRVSRCNCWDRTHHTETSVFTSRFEAVLAAQLNGQLLIGAGDGGWKNGQGTNWSL